MKAIKIALAALAVAVAGVGCVATHLPPLDRRVTVAENLGTDIWVTDVRCSKGKSAFYTFQANVVNNTSRERWVEWKVVWVDGEGMEIESISSTWNRRAIMAKEVAALSGTAPAPEAVDMRLYVRRMP